jgi:hypothetical protein
MWYSEGQIICPGPIFLLNESVNSLAKLFNPEWLDKVVVTSSFNAALEIGRIIAVTAMMRISLVSVVARSILVASQPAISGIIKSIIIRSGFSTIAASIPSFHPVP